MTSESSPIPKTQEHEAPSTTQEPDGKRSKREWLAYHGARHTRVGTDFQVAILPVAHPHETSTEKTDSDEKPASQEETS
eukprot:Nitzschia sp. Nitz4//scaffold73_size107353//14537//14773//NITZ4_004308-RA/size107353-processed-gene-0.180-mRNA-1//-1//CDS//3329557440//2441//frame0